MEAAGGTASSKLSKASSRKSSPSGQTTPSKFAKASSQKSAPSGQTSPSKFAKAPSQKSSPSGQTSPSKSIKAPKPSPSGETTVGGITTTVGEDPPEPVEPDVKQLDADVPPPEQSAWRSALVALSDRKADQELDITAMVALVGIIAIFVVGALAVVLTLSVTDTTTEGGSERYDNISVPDSGNDTRVVDASTAAMPTEDVSTQPRNVPEETL